MGEDTFRVLAALRELDAETEDPPHTKDVASRGAVSIGDAERELDKLAAVGAVDARGEDGEHFEPREATVEELAHRVDTVDELDADERDPLLEALRDGDAEPGVLSDVHDARRAAERAAGSESAD